MTDELKPCPFCGYEAFLAAEEAEDNSYQDNYAECHSCGARVLGGVSEVNKYQYYPNGPYCTIHPDARDSVVKAWNSRPTPHTNEQVQAAIERSDVEYGMLVLLAHAYAMEDVSTITEELWAICGKPSAERCRKMGLTEFDREATNALRKRDRELKKWRA